MICDTAGPNESEAPLVAVSYSNSWPREVELFEFEPKFVYRFASGHYGPKEHGEKLKFETSVRIGKLAQVAETTGRDSTGGSSPPITVLAKRNTRRLNQWSTCKTTGLNEMGALLIVACLGAVFQNCFSNAKRSLARIVSIWTTSCHKVANPKFARNVLKDRYVAEIAPPDGPPDGPVPMHANLEQGRTEAPVEQHIPSNDNAVRDNAAQHIFVKTTAGRTFWMGITGDCDTVDDIKAVCTKAEILPAWHRLVFAGRALEDGNLLADYNICKGSTVRVVPRLRGGSEDETFELCHRG